MGAKTGANLILQKMYKIKGQKEYAEALLKHYQDFISILDKDAHILYLSPAYEQKLGRSITEQISQSAYDNVHPDDLAAFKTHFRDIINEGKTISFEVRLKETSGNWVYMAATGINLINDKQINGVVINFWDITKRKEYEQALEKANETKNKLFSIIGHDLRGFAATGKMVTDYILENKENIDKEEVFILLSKTQNTNDSLNSLLNNLLVWARDQLETISFQPEHHKLLPLINENISLIRRMADEKSISISTKGESHLKAYFDKEQVNFVIRNLLQNAIKFSYNDTDISIELKESHSCVECAIHDTGTGMDKKTQTSLFQDSFPESLCGTNAEKGSGLGLKICKEFVENNNGGIWFESIKGKGSSFYFTLPCKAF